MADLSKAIDGLDSVQTVNAVRELNRRVFSTMSPETVRAATQASSLTSVPDALRTATLDSDTSVTLSRQLLHAFAADKALVPLVSAVVDQVQEDDSLFIETAIALGVLVNLTMVMASSELTFKTGSLTIKKGKVGTDLVKAIVEPIVELIKKLPAAS